MASAQARSRELSISMLNATNIVEDQDVSVINMTKKSESADISSHLKSQDLVDSDKSRDSGVDQEVNRSAELRFASVMRKTHLISHRTSLLQDEET